MVKRGLDGCVAPLGQCRPALAGEGEGARAVPARPLAPEGLARCKHAKRRLGHPAPQPPDAGREGANHTRAVSRRGAHPIDPI